MQHWFELQARAEVALYDRNTVEVSESLLGGFERLRKSMLYYVRPMRYAANWVSARLWLSMASHPDHRRPALRNAARLAKKLRRDAAPHVDVWAQLIEAGIAFQKGNDDRAVELLERAERGADELSLRLCAASARWRRAALIGGDAGEALRVQAIAWQHSEDVVNMDDMAALVTPGFDTHD